MTDNHNNSTQELKQLQAYALSLMIRQLAVEQLLVDRLQIPPEILQAEILKITSAFEHKEGELKN